jgi:hypothetical protein
VVPDIVLASLLLGIVKLTENRRVGLMYGFQKTKKKMLKCKIPREIESSENEKSKESLVAAAGLLANQNEAASKFKI